MKNKINDIMITANFEVSDTAIQDLVNYLKFLETGGEAKSSFQSFKKYKGVKKK